MSYVLVAPPGTDTRRSGGGTYRNGESDSSGSDSSAHEVLVLHPGPKDVVLNYDGVSTVTIGEETFRVERGRVFAVALHEGRVDAEQFNCSLEGRLVQDMLSGVMRHEPLREYFRASSPDLPPFPQELSSPPGLPDPSYAHVLLAVPWVFVALAFCGMFVCWRHYESRSRFTRMLGAFGWVSACTFFQGLFLSAAHLLAFPWSPDGALLLLPFFWLASVGGIGMVLVTWVVPGPMKMTTYFVLSVLVAVGLVALATARWSQERRPWEARWTRRLGTLLLAHSLLAMPFLLAIATED